MEIKDIVNRDLVNLQNCDQEPIHVPGSIQPHGVLFALNRVTSDIVFCSGNTAEFVGFEPAELLGKNFSSIFGSDKTAEILSYLRDQNSNTEALSLNLKETAFECTVHDNGSHIIVEAEPASMLEDHLNAYKQTAGFLNKLGDNYTLQELCQLVAETTREIIGYDRVMVYRFDKQFNGEVFAESKIDSIEPFLGLHYPHTDIPAQARELYLRNQLRLIVDMDYQPVPILSLSENVDYRSLDLSLSVLRSTSPIHIEYLKNMGVGATLTISLLHKGQLWGLIACHHYSSRNISPRLRMAAKLQGHFLTSQIDVRQLNEEYEISRKSNQALESLSSLKLSPKSDSLRFLCTQPELLSICNASGVSIKYGDEIFCAGKTPGREVIIFLSDFLHQQTQGNHFHTDKLKDVVPEAGVDCSHISGINYHSLGQSASYNIIWYRPETVSEVHWAGDPSKAIEKDEKGLSPRKSFELWKDVVKCQSNPWRTPEIAASANYAYTLQRHVNLMLLTEEGRKNRELNAILRETNSELENINWISTHDLQEPLRKIQLMATRLLSKEEETLSQYTSDTLLRMNDAAGRMQSLLIDILKYTRIRHTNAAEEPVALKPLVLSSAEELPDKSPEQEVKIEVTDLPVIGGISFLIRQLFHNLFSNSIKYSFDDRPVEIKVSSNPEKIQIPSHPNHETWFWEIIYKDNGIGFDPQFSDTIFNLFTRLHGPSEFKGSGVGLALCKKIMQTHGGYIKASGKPNEGAEFRLYFPVQ